MVTKKGSCIFRISTPAFIVGDIKLYSPAAKSQRTRIRGQSDKFLRKMGPDIHAIDWKVAAMVKGRMGKVHVGKIEE